MEKAIKLRRPQGILNDGLNPSGGFGRLPPGGLAFCTKHRLPFTPVSDGKGADSDSGGTPTYTYLNPNTGLVETMHALTGEVLAVQESFADVYRTPDTSNVVQAQMPDGRLVWMEKGLSADRLPDKLRGWAYSETMAEVIAQKITEGGRLTQICRQPGMPPYSVICRWRRKYPAFRKLIEQAVQDRAEWYHDQVIEAAETARESNIQVDRTKIDAYKYAAAAGDPQKFGKRTIVSGDKDAPLTFVLETGIRRPGDPGYNRDETAKLREAEKVSTPGEGEE